MKENRYEQIMKLLSDGQYASVEQLSEALYVSMPTIRRDLAAMQEMGLVVRSYGGVIARSGFDEAPVSFRAGRNTGDKLKLAAAAGKLLRDDCVIFMDESTTTLHIIDYMPQHKNILVITNSLRVLNYLAKYDIKAIALGGDFSRDSMSLYGAQADEEIRRYSIDIMFFSSSGLSADGKIVDFNQQANRLRSLAMWQSETKVFLCDGTKFGKRGAYILCELADVDYVIVNAALPETCPLGKAKLIRV